MQICIPLSVFESGKAKEYIHIMKTIETKHEKNNELEEKITRIKRNIATVPNTYNNNIEKQREFYTRMSEKCSELVELLNEKEKIEKRLKELETEANKLEDK